VLFLFCLPTLDRFPRNKKRMINSIILAPLYFRIPTNTVVVVVIAVWVFGIDTSCCCCCCCLLFVLNKKKGKAVLSVVVVLDDDDDDVEKESSRVSRCGCHMDGIVA